MWCMNRLLWHTNSDFYGIGTPTFMLYEPFLLGVGVVFNVLREGQQTLLFVECLLASCSQAQWRTARLRGELSACFCAKGRSLNERKREKRMDWAQALQVGALPKVAAKIPAMTTIRERMRRGSRVLTSSFKI